MNRERYTELKNRAEECLEQRKARAAELQGDITTASTLVSTNAVRRDEAQAAGDPQAYTEAKNLADFHTERMHKAQDELHHITAGAAIPGELYAEIKDFVEQDSNADVIEKLREVTALVDKALQIIEGADAYHAELSELATLCSNANHASTSGAYRTMSLGIFPRPVLGDLMRIQGNIKALMA